MSETIEQKCLSKGVKLTDQRRVIAKVMSEATDHPNVDELYTIVEGQLTVVTGHPSSGKSEFIDQIMVNLAEERGWKFAVCSFENEPRLHIAKLISKHFRKPFFDNIVWTN